MLCGGAFEYIEIQPETRIYEELSAMAMTVADEGAEEYMATGLTIAKSMRKN